MKKKLLSFVLCAAMIVSMTACGSNDALSQGSVQEDTETEMPQEEVQGEQPAESSAEENETVSAIDFDEEPYTIHICYAVAGQAQPDLPMIQERLDEITMREINAHVELEAVSLFSLANVYALKASSQEKNDLMIMFPGSTYVTEFANNNMIRPVEEELEAWGPEIKAVLGEMLKVGEYKGHQYAIPQNRDLSKNAAGFHLNRELCAKYDIDPAAITTIEDLEAAFAIIKENEPEVTVVMPEMTGSGIAIALFDYYDTCGSGAGVLEVGEDGSLKIVNQMEQDYYVEAIKKVREWYEKGYISKDVLTVQDTGASATRVGKCFASAAVSVGPSMGDDVSVSVVLNTDKPMVSTSDDQMILWGVASTCERPDKAIQFLNMCYGSEEVSNLMMFGVEGVHYTVLEDNSVEIFNSEGWENSWMQFGDYNKEYIRNERMVASGATSVDEFKEKESSWPTEYSPAYGFNFDATNVKTEIASCDAVNNEFGSALGCGTVDPETELPKYIQRMNDAGIQKILDEKQAQLDEWLASQN